MARISKLLTAAVVGVAVACGGEQAGEDTADARDLSMVPAESLAMLDDRPPEAATPEPQRPTTRTPPREQSPQQPRTAPAPLTLPAGTTVELAATDTITSKTNKAGDPVSATVSAAITDERGRVVIPAGAVFMGTIAEIKAAGSPGGQGTLRLAFTEVSFGGNTYGAVAESDSLATESQGRGIETRDAAKVGVGAAAGAVAGRIIGGDRRGTIIGGVVGAAAGAGVAAATKDEDIVLPAGGRIRLVLQEEMVLTPIS